MRLMAVWDTRRRASARVTACTPGALPLPAQPLAQLTRREREIARLVAEGFTNRQIAARLYLSVRTVESNIFQARAKTGAASRRELGALTAAAGLATGY